MANHGAGFANWLRDKLMKRCALFHVEAVYVDSIVSRTQPGSTIQPDRRPHMASPSGAFPIGAMLPQWNANYKQAMSEAKVMVFVVTSEYRDSVWCMQEWGQMQMENGRRRRNGLDALSAVVLEFVPTADLLGADEDNVQRIPVTQIPAVGEALLWDHGDWCITPAQLNQVMLAVEAAL